MCGERTRGVVGSPPSCVTLMFCVWGCSDFVFYFLVTNPFVGFRIFETRFVEFVPLFEWFYVQ